MGKRYIREQWTLCGDRYGEVDLFWINEAEHKASTRRKKSLPPVCPSRTGTTGTADGILSSCSTAIFQKMVSITRSPMTTHFARRMNSSLTGMLKTISAA